MSVRRIAILIDNPIVQEWQRHIIQEIRNHQYLEIAAFILNKAPPKRRLGTKIFKLSKLVWFAVDRTERIISRLLFRTPNALLESSIKEWMTEAQVIEIQPQAKRGTYFYFSAEDIDRIRALDLDVLIRFGFGIIRGDILTAVPYGIWSYHHGDTARFRGGPSCFWEWYNRCPSTSATLQLLTPDLDNGVVLQKAHYMTFTRSWNENRNRVFWKSTLLMTDMLDALARSDSFVAEQRTKKELVEDNFFDGPLLVTPRFWQSVNAFAKFVARNGEVVLRVLFYVHQWRPLVCSKPSKIDSLRKYREIVPPKDRFWADPFLIQKCEKTYIFVEEYKYRRKIGEIAVLECKDDRLVDHRTIMSAEHHLSYPFVFEFDGHLYMVPETHEKRAIQLWRSIEFPDKWEHVSDLISGVSAVDSTLFEYDGHWWIFTNIDRSRLGFEHNDELHAFYAETPLSTNWQPHVLNPLIRNAGEARQGGRIYRDAHGRLVRVAQNNTARYGYSLSFQEITSLSPTDFTFRFLTRIEPLWSENVLAIHTFDTDAKTFVFDACFRRRKYI